MYLKLKFTFVLFFLITILKSNPSFSQGCSDAGFCTMGAMKPNQPFSKKINLKLRSIELSHYLAENKIGDIITSHTADINIGLSSKYTVQVKVPYMVVYGRLANTNGLGDISLSASRNLVAKEKYQLNFTVGSKIPTNKSDFKTETGLPLPNYYQSSLGTYDIIAGLSFITKRWLIATGYQQALTRNGNQFLWGPWRAARSEDLPLALRYPVSKELQRGIDGMLRIERNFRLSRFNAHIGLLGIYRFTEDEFTNRFGVREKQKGTTGLALSGITGLGYSFSARSGIKLIIGAQLIPRYSKDFFNKLSLDGLTRTYVSTIGYEFRF